MADDKEKTTATAKPLTLQQKFVKLREAIPAVIKKKHSDGVKYKFARITDIYELLCPAMNEWGVNFDIVAEKATQHDEIGNDIYYHSYQQQTQKGPRTVWVYESDITICWTNADNAEDMQEITLHAIGTNDGGPDKAKGSAWTYCLKYYLFEKFNVDQAEDDPDMKDLSDGQTEPYGSAGATEAQRKAYGLSEAQLARLYAKAKSAGLSKDRIDARIKEKYNKEDPAKLTKTEYEEICAALDSATQGGNTNA